MRLDKYSPRKIKFIGGTQDQPLILFSNGTKQISIKVGIDSNDYFHVLYLTKGEVLEMLRVMEKFEEQLKTHNACGVRR